jgi:hypothetical protein
MHEPGDFVMSISPFDLKPRTCMVLQILVDGGIARYLVTDGPNEWTTYMARKMPAAPTPKRKRRSAK